MYSRNASVEGHSSSPEGWAIRLRKSIRSFNFFRAFVSTFPESPSWKYIFSDACSEI